MEFYLVCQYALEYTHLIEFYTHLLAFILSYYNYLERF
jgi:hypothetical protein